MYFICCSPCRRCCRLLLLPIPPSFAALVPSASVQWGPLCHHWRCSLSYSQISVSPSIADAESLVANLSPALPPFERIKLLTS